MAVSGRVPLLALIHAQAADCLVHRVQDRGPVLGEEVTVNVLSRLDPGLWSVGVVVLQVSPCERM